MKAAFQQTNQSFQTIETKLDTLIGLANKPSQSAKALDTMEVYQNTRPADWLPMPEPADNEIYLLFHILDGVSSLLTFTVIGTRDYTVELGTVANGVFSASSNVSVASGTKYEAELFSADYETLTSDGMKQVMVKISGTDMLSSIIKQNREQ